MANLQKILRIFEENLDLDRIRETVDRHKNILIYKNAEKIGIKVVYPGRKPEWHDLKQWNYSEEYDSMEKMMSNELLLSLNTLDIEVVDDTLPMIRANYGVGILPSLFGINCRIIENNMPWVDHVNSIDDIQRLIDNGIPDLRTGMGARVFDTNEFFSEQLEKYPKCKQGIPIYHPDLQGPFNVAHLIWGTEIYYAIFDQPELVHKFMKLITETYIAFLNAIKKNIKDVSGEYVYHWRCLYKGGVVLRDDTAVNLSREIYEEFVRPYDELVLKAFGGGSIHYCGRADNWVFSMMESEGLRAMNFGQPPNMTFGIEFIEKLYCKLREKGIAIVDYNIDKDSLDALARLDYRMGITYSLNASNRTEALGMLKKMGR